MEEDQGKIRTIKVSEPRYQRTTTVKVHLLDVVKTYTYTYDIVCKGCGIAATVKHKNGQFCTRSCASTYNERKKGTNPKTTLTCVQCQKQFVRYNPPTWHDKKQVFCSRACQHQYGRERSTADEKRAASCRNTKKWQAAQRQTEEGRARLKAIAHRTYLNSKAKRKSNEQSKIN